MTEFPDLSDRRQAHRVAGMVLAVIVFAFQIATLQGDTLTHADPDMAPGSLLELILPCVFADSSPTGQPLFGTRGPTVGRNLVARVLIPGTRSAPRATLYAGMLPLLLAVLAAFAARGHLANVGRIGLIVGLVLVVSGLPIGLGGGRLIVASLALLAGLGLTGLFDDEANGGAPTLALGTVSVLLAAALAAVALQAGASSDAEVVEPLLRHLPVNERRDWFAPTLASNAAQLRVVLDRSALAAFASMTALLLHLKGRKRWTLVLMLLVIVADLATARFA